MNHFDDLIPKRRISQDPYAIEADHVKKVKYTSADGWGKYKSKKGLSQLGKAFK